MKFENGSTLLSHKKNYGHFKLPEEAKNDFFEDFEKVKNIKLPDQLNLADSFVSSPKIAVEVSLIKNKKKSLN